jgi:hypothetical protein
MIQSSRRTFRRQFRLRPHGLSLITCFLVGTLQGADNGDDGNKQGQPKADKSSYSLFNPTPRASLREMTTDRPDQTESAYTVDAGHFQVEMDVVSAVFDSDRSGGRDVRATVWGIAPLNLKLGLLNNLDMQFMLEPYGYSRVKDRVAGTVDEASGFGDLQTRLKVNLWGNDDGTTALAIMPFVKWPLSASSLRNGKTEGGVIIPLAVGLPGGWAMGLMTEFDFLRNAGNDGYDTEFVNSITFGHDIIGNLGGYVEFFSTVSSSGDADWQGQADVGFTYAVNDNTRFDFGCNFGVTKSAPDFNPFIGLSWRY